MEPSKINSLLLICMLFISTAAPIFGCGSCGSHPKITKPGSGSKSPKGGPIGLPPITVPPVTLPPVGILPPVGTIPPVGVLPPVVTNPSPAKKPCPPSGEETCPVDTLKLGGCVDLLGGLVHIGLGDPAVNECCPILAGLAEVEAAVCLCTTLKIKALSLNLYVPIALQLLISCGKTPPPGYTCSL